MGLGNLFKKKPGGTLIGGLIRGIGDKFTGGLVSKIMPKPTESDFTPDGKYTGGLFHGALTNALSSIGNKPAAAAVQATAAALPPPPAVVANAQKAITPVAIKAVGVLAPSAKGVQPASTAISTLPPKDAGTGFGAKVSDFFKAHWKLIVGVAAPVVGVVIFLVARHKKKNKKGKR